MQNNKNGSGENNGQSCNIFNHLEFQDSLNFFHIGVRINTTSDFSFSKLLEYIFCCGGGGTSTPPSEDRQSNDEEKIFYYGPDLNISEDEIYLLALSMSQSTTEGRVYEV